jgi:uncharacterized small protein (DUF1192 family)
MRRLVAAHWLEDERRCEGNEADRGDARNTPPTGGSVHRATLRDGLGDRPGGYTGAVPDEAADNGFPSADEVDVDALFAALREEIRRSGADPGDGSEPDDRLAARAEAERLWPVSADRPLRLRPGVRGGIGTPVKAVLKKMMRWYVEPFAYDQRSFNAAALRLVDDLERRVATLEDELARLRSADPR